VLAEQRAIGQDEHVVNRFWSRLWKPTEREPNATCPVCDKPVLAEPEAMFSPFGPMMAKRTREELVAACATHGHPPFNDATRSYLERHP
jgi:hypothetical protein